MVDGETAVGSASSSTKSASLPGSIVIATAATRPAGSANERPQAQHKSARSQHECIRRTVASTALRLGL